MTSLMSSCCSMYIEDTYTPCWTLCYADADVMMMSHRVRITVSIYIYSYKPCYVVEKVNSGHCPFAESGGSRQNLKCCLFG